jgi:hypothetical protein
VYYGGCNLHVCHLDSSWATGEDRSVQHRSVGMQPADVHYDVHLKRVYQRPHLLDLSFAYVHKVLYVSLYASARLPTTTQTK